MCDRDCFNCPYEDCVVDELTDTEKALSRKRDREITDSSLSNNQLRFRSITRKASRKYNEKHRQEKREYDKKYYHGEIERGVYRKAVVKMDMNGTILGVFKSIADAAEIVDGTPSLICQVCRRNRKSAYGYVWRYKEEVG